MPLGPSRLRPKWLFFKVPFGKFDAFLRAHGFQARKGQIVDAAIVEVPRQRNTRPENERIKHGEAEQVRAEWPPAKAAQKDTDARWTQKNGKNHYGYKEHTSVDVKHKLVRAFEVTPAQVHDHQVFEVLLTPNAHAEVYADSAYHSAEHEALLRGRGLRPRLQRKAVRHRGLTERERRGNRARATVRARVEHVFGTLRQRLGDTVIRTIGLVRAKTKIGLRLLAYNMSRFAYLAGSGA